jgi:hypothetical protein
MKKNKQDYLEGKENWFIRAIFYIGQGNLQLKNYRDVGLGIVALFIYLKTSQYISNPLWLVVLILLALPIMFLYGWYFTHRMARIMEWLAIKFSTVFQKKNFENVDKQVKLAEENNRLLKEILKKL